MKKSIMTGKHIKERGLNRTTVIMIKCGLATQFRSSTEINICEEDIPVIKAYAVVIKKIPSVVRDYV